MRSPGRREELLHVFNEVAPIARTFGMKLAFTADDRAIITLAYNPALDHALGDIHGGVFATMLDNAGWFTAALGRDESCWVATAELSLHLLRRATATDLRAEAWYLKRGKRQDVLEMKLQDAAGELVAHATGTFITLPGVALTPNLIGGPGL
jgi:uncharacterized protein (TIGR00369 family)